MYEKHNPTSCYQYRARSKDEAATKQFSSYDQQKSSSTKGGDLYDDATEGQRKNIKKKEKEKDGQSAEEGLKEQRKRKKNRPRRVPTFAGRGRSTAWTFDWCNLPVQQSEHPLIDVHVHPESQRRQAVAHWSVGERSSFERERRDAYRARKQVEAERPDCSLAPVIVTC